MLRLAVLGHLLLLLHGVSSYKILVLPYAAGFNSRLLNMQKLADILATDGHEVTVLLNTIVKDHQITKHAKSLLFSFPESLKTVENMTKPTSMMDFFTFMQEFLDIEYSFLDRMISDHEVMETIRNAKFDLVVADINAIPNLFLVSHLNITTIWYQNYLMPVDPRVFYPILPSFVCTMPGVMCRGAGDMDFTERVLNFLGYVSFNTGLQDMWLNWLVKLTEERQFALKVPMADVMKNKVMIVNADFVLDAPIPTMPHVFPISGLFHNEPSPLDKQFLDIIESSEPHGVILFSFGTLISEFDADKADMFARVFGRLPHSVIWKYTGQRPPSLKANTHLVKWFPQGDLLANPRVKLFITHCGISSTFESALNGVPVVAIPQNGDQSDNAAKLTKRARTGVTLDFNTLTEDVLEQGIQEVLTNPVFKENAVKASNLLNDRLVSPKQQLRHLVNFTIKSGGARHLFHPYAVDMHWFHFYSLDVILFLLVIILILSAILALLLRCIVKLVMKLCGHKKQKIS